MTAIVGLAQDGHVWMGGDSAGIADREVTIRADPKVFLRGEFIFGVTSSFRLAQLLHYEFNIPHHPDDQDGMGYMVCEFIDALRKCLRSGGFAKRAAEVETAGQFLVGHRGHLYLIDADYQVGEAACGFDAIGSGRLPARGAMWATERLDMAPVTRVRLALRAAEHCFSTVCAPFQIISSRGDVCNLG